MVKHEDGHVVVSGDEVEGCERRQDARPADYDRHPGGNNRPEGDHKDHQREREGEFLSVADILVARVLDVQIHGRRSRHVGLQALRTDLAPHLLDQALSFIHRRLEADQSVALLAVFRDETRVFGVGISGYEPYVRQLVDIRQCLLFLGSELLAAGRGVLALEHYRQRRGRDAEVLDHRVLDLLGFGVGPLETAALQTVGEVGGEESAR